MKNKTGRWYEDSRKVGMFQTINYVYEAEDENGAHNCWASGPTNLEALLIGIGIAAVTIILVLF